MLYEIATHILSTTPPQGFPSPAAASCPTVGFETPPETVPAPACANDDDCSVSAIQRLLFPLLHPFTLFTYIVLLTFSYLSLVTFGKYHNQCVYRTKLPMPPVVLAAKLEGLIHVVKLVEKDC